MCWPAAIKTETASFSLQKWGTSAHRAPPVLSPLAPYRKSEYIGCVIPAISPNLFIYGPRQNRIQSTGSD
jgi:hypothetical protein